MNILEIIDSKKYNKQLTEEQIKYFIKEFNSGQIVDYQAAALLMAIRLNGMTEKEIFFLTQAMIDSGDRVEINNSTKITIDKHSTGGVGDKTSLILMPLLAAFNFCIPKMSGRGLGHTGGTLDKLEVFKGFDFSLTEKQFLQQLEDIGIAIIGQTENLVPADKKLYALRDVTGTVDSIPLIASSIMSKKIASGAGKIILDIKCGSGAFTKTLEDAELLAQTMVDIGKSFGVATIAHVTEMNEPLGRAIGNSLEVSEAIECLKGNFVDHRLKELIYSFTKELLIETNYCLEEEATSIIDEMFLSGVPLEKFKEMVAAQGGNVENFEDFAESKFKEPILASKTGYVNGINALDIGISAMELGAGRKLITDQIDPTVGIELLKVTGDFVQENDMLAYAYYNDQDKFKNVMEKVKSAYQIEAIKNENHSMILSVIK